MDMKITKRLLKLLAIHVLSMLCIVSVIIWLFFKLALPVITKHGQTIIVPNLKGIDIQEAAKILTSRQLKYKIMEDIIYLPTYPTSAVLEQYPKPGTHVKEGRSIYITINALHPPQVSMPNLIDGSIRNAYITLKSKGLTYNTITYIPDIAKNAVLQQWHDGKPIAAGTSLAQGSKIDLVVGTGLNKKTTTVPDVTGIAVEEAEILLLESGIFVNTKTYEHINNLSSGTIFKQYPTIGKEVPLGSPIHIFIVSENIEEGITKNDIIEEPVLIEPETTTNNAPISKNLEKKSLSTSD